MIVVCGLIGTLYLWWSRTYNDTWQLALLPILIQTKDIIQGETLIRSDKLITQVEQWDTGWEEIRDSGQEMTLVGWTGMRIEQVAILRSTLYSVRHLYDLRYFKGHFNAISTTTNLLYECIFISSTFSTILYGYCTTCHNPHPDSHWQDNDLSLESKV